MSKTNYHIPTGADVIHLKQVMRDIFAQIRGRRILDARRRRTVQLVLFGLGITFFSLGLDVIGALRNMENWFYDQRCYYFQYMTPKPSESLVHIDIDDSALQATEKWPWPRSLQARAIREMNLAGPKMIFLDIVYPEADKDPAQDADLAAAIGEKGNVLAPVTLGLKVAEATPPLQLRMAGYLREAGRLNDSVATLRSRLSGPALSEFDRMGEAQVQTVYLAARRDAARSKVREVLERFPDAALPKIYEQLGMPANLQTALHIEVANQWALLCRQNAVGRFGLSISPALVPDLAVPLNVDPPMVDVARSTAHSGFVDFIPSYAGDSKVRFVPLFVNVGGKAFPHVSLVMACAYLGVDLQSLKLSADRIVIPAHTGGAEIVIPTRTLKRENDQNAAFVADIPWFGGREWETMYDVPNHRLYKQHYSMALITNVLETERNIDINVKGMKSLMTKVMAPFDPDTLSVVVDMSVTADTLGDFRAFVDSAVKDSLLAKQKELSELAIKTADQQNLLENIAGLQRKIPEYEKLLEDLMGLRVKQREEVRRKIGGKIVLVGFAATGMVDQYPTALHNTAPGVVAHGVMVNGVLTRNFWGRAPDYYTHVLTLVLGTLATLFVALGSPAKATVGAFASVAAYTVLNGLVLFDRYNLVVGFAGPMTAMVATWAGVTLVRFILEIRERNRITARFSNYVDPALVNYYVQNPEEQAFAGREKEATVVFTDLEGFTTLSEKLGAGTVAILNDYVAKMTPIIRSNNGFVDKFLGDGIMFEFNAIAPNPNHAADALNAVVLMQQAMIGINDSLRARDLPTLKMRVGVNTGSMIVGDAGGGGASNFTVLGDNVNLAARLESANKAFGSLMMVAETSLIAAGKERFAVRPLARIQVKGKEQAVMVYEPLCLSGEVTPEINTLIRLSTAVYEPYVAGDFEGCMKACDEMDAVVGETKFTKLYHKESTHLLAEGAGPDFDGRIALSEK